MNTRSGADRTIGTEHLVLAPSARNLTAALDGLSAVLPAPAGSPCRNRSHRADSRGRPELVAAQLRAFVS